MNTISTMRPLLRETIHFDRSRISLARALRNTVGVVAPLAVGAATGQLGAGLIVCIGALQVAFSDSPGPYGRRAGAMLLAGLSAALSVFVGSTTGATPWLAVLLAAAWGFAGGMLVALGTIATQIGLTSVVLLLVFSAHPADPAAAASLAGLVLLGAALQIALAVLAWPVRRLTPQRNALAQMYHELALYARAPTGASSAPPATGATTHAHTTLGAPDLDRSAQSEALRGLLHEAERVRLSVLGLNQMRSSFASRAVALPLQPLRDVLRATADILDALADALPSADSVKGARELMQRAEAARHELRQWTSTAASTKAQRAEWEALLAQVDVLLRELRTSLELAGEIADEDAGVAGTMSYRSLVRVITTRPPKLRLRDPVATLRANLSLQSAACRHALRLAACLALADALAHAIGLTRGYWVPMTAAIVLKPDFTATFSRGLGRLLGTFLGLILASALVYAVFGEETERIALVALLTFAMRSVGPANYALLVVAVSGLVVTLTSFAGASPEATILARGVNTLIGGALALILYGAWPTWEGSLTPGILAEMLDAYRGYFDAVLTGYRDTRHNETADVQQRRLAARLARSNAEASVSRLSNEPATSPDELARDEGLLTSSHRFANATMALEAQLLQGDDQQRFVAPAALGTFTSHVDETLRMVSTALRQPGAPRERLPNLRADQEALAGEDGFSGTRSEASSTPAAPHVHRLVALISETDRITEALYSLAELVGGFDR